ncbi:MAG: hypothetical protein HY042_01835, partial [Spirochaetia bacterium]|nr:hypothetical protein [Spirochaetia bacterium]
MKTAGPGKSKSPDKKKAKAAALPQKKAPPVDLLLDFARKNVAPVLDQGGRSFQLQGVPETSRAFFAASIARWLENGKASQPVLVVCPTQTEAEELASEALLFLEQERVAFFPGYAGIPYESAGVSAEICQERTRFLYRALKDGFQLGFVSAEALLRLLPAPDRMSAAGLELREKERPGPLREKLTAMGYEYGDLVDVPGEFCVKGSIVDI